MIANLLTSIYKTSKIGLEGPLLTNKISNIEIGNCSNNNKRVKRSSFFKKSKPGVTGYPIFNTKAIFI